MNQFTTNNILPWPRNHSEPCLGVWWKSASRKSYLRALSVPIGMPWNLDDLICLRKKSDRKPPKHSGTSAIISNRDGPALRVIYCYTVDQLWPSPEFDTYAFEERTCNRCNGTDDVRLRLFSSLMCEVGNTERALALCLAPVLKKCLFHLILEPSEKCSPRWKDEAIQNGNIHSLPSAHSFTSLSASLTEWWQAFTTNTRPFAE